MREFQNERPIGPECVVCGAEALKDVVCRQQMLERSQQHPSRVVPTRDNAGSSRRRRRLGQRISHVLDHVAELCNIGVFFPVFLGKRVVSHDATDINGRHVLYPTKAGPVVDQSRRGVASRSGRQLEDCQGCW